MHRDADCLVLDIHILLSLHLCIDRCGPYQDRPKRGSLRCHNRAVSVDRHQVIDEMLITRHRSDIIHPDQKCIFLVLNREGIHYLLASESQMEDGRVHPELFTDLRALCCGIWTLDQLVGHQRLSMASQRIAAEPTTAGSPSPRRTMSASLESRCTHFCHSCWLKFWHM